MHRNTELQVEILAQMCVAQASVMVDVINFRISITNLIAQCQSGYRGTASMSRHD